MEQSTQVEINFREMSKMLSIRSDTILITINNIKKEDLIDIITGKKIVSKAKIIL